MNKLVVICGPTATGKTTLAIKLAKDFNGEIVSADSRQVYKGMDIGTGKDIENGKWKMENGEKGHWEIAGIPVWLYDVVEPDQEFSVAQYVELAWKVIEDIWQRGKLPFLVGGTGFYIKSVMEGIENLGISRDEKLRENLEKLTVEQLQKILEKTCPERLREMNHSDQNNPRRLIRAIEIASQYQISNIKYQKYKAIIKNFKTLFVGLTVPKKVLYERIDHRVKQMIQAGLENEIKNLLKQGCSWDLPAMSGIGYAQWQPHFEKKANLSEVIQKIKLATHAFARRQLTWFGAQKRIIWFDISARDCYDKVKQAVYEYTKN